MLVDWLIFALSLSVVATFTCCCGGGGGPCSVYGDCCDATFPTSFDVTLPDDWTNPGSRPCTTCGDIGGTTYTLTNYYLTDNGCGGSGLASIENRWIYEATAFCTGDCASTVGDKDYRLQIVLGIFCTLSQCIMQVSVTLIRDKAAVPFDPFDTAACCDAWIWNVDFGAGTDCDTEEWTLDYDSALSNQNTTGGADWQCVIAGTPAQVTVTKT